MSGTSNVGNSQVYEAGDQRNYKDSEIEEAKKENRFHEGKENSHKAQDSSKFPNAYSTCTFVLAIPHITPPSIIKYETLTTLQRMSDPLPTSSSVNRSARRRTMRS